MLVALTGMYMAEIISSIDEYITVVTQENDLWFRGVGSINYLPKPKVHWCGIDEDIEGNLTYSFIREHLKYKNSNFDNPWYTYALMQHHGLPTRLLDWSKSPLVALYFSLTQEGETNTNRRVWMLNPYKLNDCVFSIPKVYCPSQMEKRKIYIEHSFDIDKKELIPYDIGAIPFFLDSYLPTNLKIPGLPNTPDHPLCIETLSVNGRMAAQQSVFTIHGSDTNSIDELFQDDVIRHIDILETSSGILLEQLNRLGINEETIFCDLDSLCKRLCREQNI